MSEFALAHSESLDPEVIAAQCATRLGDVADHTLGFVYATSPLAGRFEVVVETLRRRTGIEHWVGTVGHGICATGVETFDRPAVVVLTGRFPEGALRLLPSLADEESLEEIEVSGTAGAVGVVHGDPRNAHVISLVESIARASGAYLVGGLSSADGAYPQAAGDDVVEGGVSGVLFETGFDVAVGLSQGCSPVGPTHEVGRSEGNILITLDGHRAYDVLCEDVGIAEGADPRPWLRDVHAAIPVAGSDQADYVVRNLMGIDPERGLVGIAETLGKGERVMFVRRDAESAAKDLGRMLDELKVRADGKPKAGLYFSCVARGPNLFEDKAYEMKAIQEAFGDIPVAGFFGNGEISNDRVYGYTGVLLLFC